MLTAFYQSYLMIVGVCALFCLLVNLYNFLYHATLGARNRALERKIQKMTARLSELEEQQKENEDSLGLSLGFPLRRGRDLRGLYDAMDRLGWMEAQDVPGAVRAALMRELGLCVSSYKRYDDPQRALLVSLGNRLEIRTEQYRSFLNACVGRVPLYLRIVALRGCTIQGDEELMMKTLGSISSQGGAYSVKMITDLLILYTGDLEKLFERVWKDFGRYSENVGCSVLGVMTAERMEGFAPQALEVLQNPKMYLECRIAAIKFFGAVEYEPAQAVLAQLLSSGDWEYAAVAAKALSGYDCTDLGDVLMEALASRNWYVRYNSAMTLVARRSDLVEQALAHKDRYARDITRYALDISGGGNT